VNQPAVDAVPAPRRVTPGIMCTGSTPEYGVVLIDDVTFEIRR
jgi:hypothetical protein